MRLDNRVIMRLLTLHRYQESSNHRVEHETLLSVDTDMIGPFGYCADFSRSFYTGHETNALLPKDRGLFAECKTLYNLAFEQVQYNTGILKAGMSYKELQQKLWRCPEQFKAQRYTCVIHGVGSCDEYPCVFEAGDGMGTGDDVIEPGTCLSVESYIGAVGGTVGVKLEDQVFVKDDGSIEIISTFPYENDLLI